jgi:hypothetical protein
MWFDKLNIDPARNPAILDTACWNADAARELLASGDTASWQAARDAAEEGRPLPAVGGAVLHDASRTDWRGSTFCLATLADAQQVLLEFGPSQGRSILGEPIASLSWGEGDRDRLSAYRTDLEGVAGYLQAVDPGKAPQAMGPEPRLGIGSRMTTASWPGIYRAMAGGGFAANAIQNSVREANVLADLLAARPPELNYGPNLGTFASGHAGSSFEGLWLYGVLEALKVPGRLRYGADADHMQVKRGAGGLERALRVLESARHYTFYTMDVSDILDYAAVHIGPAEAEERLARCMPDLAGRTQFLAYHRPPLRVGGEQVQLDDAGVGRFAAKYWEALAAMEQMTAHIARLKGDHPFDLEFAVDEVPAGTTACESITSHQELLFIIRECARRGLPVTHVAPNVGVEKEMDYRCPDGLEGLEARVRAQTEMARAFNLILDFHSGDDLSARTRRAIGRGTGGHNQFKVSPSLQLLFAETLADLQPDTFRLWWEDTLAFARQQAAQGSPLAARGLALYEGGPDRAPSAQHMVFRHYCFASLGRRDAAGQFVLRETLYDLSPAFHRAYGERLVAFLDEIAGDLFRPDARTPAGAPTDESVG